ncbi:MAG: biliverdin-producing heme oxygenase, partial [Myxococcota bacterium]
MSLAERLKRETESLHRLAERHPMQRELMTGHLDLDGYRRFLGQLYFFHAAIDVAWSGMQETHRSGFPRPGLIRHALLQDLSDLNSTPECMSIGPAASRFLGGLVNDGAAGVGALGARYVFEGACNGGVFIARAMRKGYGADCPPIRHLNPYGDAQRA